MEVRGGEMTARSGVHDRTVRFQPVASGLQSVC